MPLASSPDCLLLPEDQVLEALFPSVGDSNTFEEYFNEDLYHLDATSDSKDSADQFDNFLANGIDTHEYSRLPSLPESTIKSQSPPQPWKKGLWCLNQAPSQTVTVEKIRKPQIAALASPYSTDHGERLGFQYPQSPPVSPTSRDTKKFGTSPNVAAYRDKGSARLPQSREATLSPSPMYVQLPTHSKMEQVETWQQDFQNFNIKPAQERRSQIQKHHTRGQYALRAQQINAATASQNAAIGLAISTYESLSENVHGSDNSVGIDPILVEQNAFSLDGLTSPTHHPTVGQHNHFDPLPTPVWTTESLHSSSSSHQSYDTLPPSVHTAQSGQTTYEIFKNQDPAWWAPLDRPTQTRWGASQPTSHPDIAAPVPQRNLMQLLAQNFDQGQGGLGIHYSELDQMDRPVFRESKAYCHGVAAETAVPYSPHSNMPLGFGAIPPLSMPHPHNFTNVSPFTTPRKTRRSPSQSPSPGVFPANATPRTLRQCSPTRGGYEHTHHRRKSIHKSGPIKDTHDPLPHISTTRSRSRSTSKPPRTPKTPKTPKGGFGSIDFVNFTPKDSMKLLSDVAPSGSSKTRARREAEAREKRKKLTDAALKAVSSTGGDVEALKKAILV